MGRVITRTEDRGRKGREKGKGVVTESRTGWREVQEKGVGR